jgi:hypothetical protein
MTTDNPGVTPHVIGSPKNVPLRWQDSDEPSPQVANAFQLQLTPEGLLFVAGFAKPPLFSGTLEEQAKQAQALDSVTVRPNLRLLIGYHHVQSLTAAFQQALEQIQKGLPIPPVPGPQSQNQD